MQSLLAAQSGMVSFPETQFFLLVSSAPERQSVAESVLDQLLVGFSKHIQISAFAASRLRTCSTSFQKQGQESEVNELQAGVERAFAVFP